MSMNARHLRAVEIAKALADPTRYRLLLAIAAQEELSCAELVERFPIAQATVSHHLKVLASAGLVAVRKSGQFHYYRAVPEVLRDHGAGLVKDFTAKPAGRGKRPARKAGGRS
jgi:ArsR family transcriptional regulator